MCALKSLPMNRQTFDVEIRIFMEIDSTASFFAVKAANKSPVNIAAVTIVDKRTIFKYPNTKRNAVIFNTIIIDNIVQSAKIMILA